MASPLSDMCHGFKMNVIAKLQIFLLYFDLVLGCLINSFFICLISFRVVETLLELRCPFFYLTLTSIYFDFLSLIFFMEYNSVCNTSLVSIRSEIFCISPFSFHFTF